ncbi:MAG: hypothetical protein ABSC65_20670 [Acidobacteriaceae bacterium]
MTEVILPGFVSPADLLVERGWRMVSLSTPVVSSVNVPGHSVD